MIVYINGDYIKEQNACVSVHDRGLTLGDGIFDTLLITNSAPVFAPVHFARLKRHAEIMRLTVPFDEAGFIARIETLIAKNNAKSGRYALRTTLTRGPVAGLGLTDSSKQTVIMRLSSAPPLASKAIRVLIAQTVCRNDQSPLAYIKSLNYGDTLLARAEAMDKGCDDAILLNTAGAVSCGTVGNIFVETNDGALVTPPLSDGVLDGTLRQSLLAAMTVTEVSLTPETLKTAKALYLTNSLRGITPIKTLISPDGETTYNYAQSTLWTKLQEINETLTA